MKKLIFLVLIIAVVATVTSFSSADNPASKQTEEYALMQLTESWRDKTIRIATTIGLESTTYESVSREKKERFDWAPIVKKMNELNAQGFELLNSSIAVSREVDSNTETIHHSYTFVRRIN